ncbi:DNA-binding transcriptional regulator, AcrR family [Nakamurella panacisegetis]|uniref:DNA-binding transcriptional regulator, AcrR family n=1 Tax=Nakamurella panacisegetis TaxID=1090615 RepID=A0A1H0IMH6_9ACTN|nr:TetR/AcrR family transcriptional regulator [Nakamurella panacisegetis]SDO32545.1 DNA-binding transcriptional regulator, AcrR family [Nakamurella panacisegetis]
MTALDTAEGSAAPVEKSAPVPGPTPSGPSEQPAVPSEAATPRRPLRADAQRNRDKLIEVATSAFVRDGSDIALEEIARRADVGIGTLYRHFPTREALVVAVYRKQIDDLGQLAHDLPLTHGPADALRLWMQGFVEYGAVKRGLVGLLKSMMETESDLFDQARATLRGSAGALMKAAAEAGEIRPDFEPGDVIRALGGICMATDRPDAGTSALALVDLVFDGLRYGAPARS